MIALIDGDIVKYRVGFASEKTYYMVFNEEDPDYFCAMFTRKKDAVEWINSEEGYHIVPEIEAEPLEKVLFHVDRVMNYIIFRSGANGHRTYLTGDKSFRKELSKEYKANRDPSHKPIHHKAISRYLINYWNARYAREGLEADDELGIHQNENTIIVSTDKDLDTIPGWHYNWVHDRKYYVSHEMANRNFWTQMLVGDTADNVKGIPKVGPVTARKILEGIHNSEHMEERVKSIYNTHSMGDQYEINKKLLIIKREYNEEKLQS
jgi:hypothetical protein